MEVSVRLCHTKKQEKRERGKIVFLNSLACLLGAWHPLQPDFLISPHEIHSLMRLRPFLTSERRRFPSTSFLFSERDLGASLRRALAAAARACCLRAARCSAILAASRSRAMPRFMLWLRESETVTESPVGRWVKVTAVETLFTCCPPGPEERAKLSRRSSSLSLGIVIAGSGPKSSCRLPKPGGCDNLFS